MDLVVNKKVTCLNRINLGVCLCELCNRQVAGMFIVYIAQ